MRPHLSTLAFAAILAMSLTSCGTSRSDRSVAKRDTQAIHPPMMLPQNSNSGLASPDAPLTPVSRSAAGGIPGAASTTATPVYAESIRYDERAAAWRIAGGSDYGDVSLTAQLSPVVGDLSIYGKVGQEAIALDASRIGTSNYVTVRGDCGGFGRADLRIELGEPLDHAKLTGKIGKDEVMVDLPDVRDPAHWTTVTVQCVAILFDAS